MRATASEILQKAMLLEDGGDIKIPCASYEEMETLRTRLYKVRRQLEGQHSALARAIDITRKVRENSWFIIVAKEMSFPGIIVTEGGISRPFERIETAIEDKVFGEAPEAEEERRKELILKDTAAGIMTIEEAAIELSLKPEEVELLLTKKAELSFEEAASKIEEGQGLLEGPELAEPEIKE